MNIDDENIFFESLIDNHYPQRPQELNSESLYNFASNYDIVDSEPKRVDAQYYKYGNRFVKKRKQPKLIDHYQINAKTAPEQYYYALLLLFKPWRKFEDLKGKHDTYAEAFAEEVPINANMYSYHEKLIGIQAAKDAINKEVEDIESRVNVPERNEEENDNIIDFQAIDDGENDQDNDIPNPTEDVHDLIAQLNNDQKRVFEDIAVYLDAYVKEFDGPRNVDQNPRTLPTKVLRKFVSGVGGTGKSYLIKTIRAYVVQELNKKVAVTAPTGIAASNINAVTIHRLLHLPIDDDDIKKYATLSNEKLKKMRHELKDVVLLIIDEISMVSNVLFMYIHFRLAEIFDTTETNDGWFGRLNVIVLGDLLQLPPVRQKSVFIQINRDEALKYFGAPSTADLWQLFSYDELLINMRQQNDPDFARILDGVRLGILTASDEKILRERIIDAQHKDTEQCLKKLVTFINTMPLHTICLLPTVKQCSTLNKATLQTIDSPLYKLVADDHLECKTDAQRQRCLRQLQKFRDNANKTAGLSDEINVKIGAKVMLLRNLDVTLGLVNGAIGRLLKFIADPITQKPIKLSIQFEKGINEIEPANAKFQIMKGIYVHRTQFPIALAHAITNHKSQGLSAKSAVMDIGDSIFAEGQIYVALSRLTTLAGLHLINFNPKQIKVQESAILEYNRLRSIYRPDLELLKQPQNNMKNVTDKNIYLQQKKNLADIMNPNTKKKNNKAVTDLIRQFKGMLNANGASCYINASLQCLFHIKDVQTAINMSSSSELKTLFHLYMDKFQDGTISASTIRVLFTQFNNNEQQDASEFMVALIDKFNYLESVFSIDQIDEYKCMTCKHIIQNKTRESTYALHMPHNFDYKNKLTFNALYNSNNQQYRPVEGACPRCQSSELYNRTYIEKAANAIILVVQAVHNNQWANLTLNGVPQSTIKVANSNYELNSAIFRHGSSMLSGHYTALMRVDSTFIEANDIQISSRS